MKCPFCNKKVLTDYPFHYSYAHFELFRGFDGIACPVCRYSWSVGHPAKQLATHIVYLPESEAQEHIVQLHMMGYL